MHIEDYLNDGKLYVNVSNASSHLLEMSTGVPRGSILGTTCSQSLLPVHIIMQLKWPEAHGLLHHNFDVTS